MTTHFDAIVMGGGIIGALSAYELSKAKKRVLLLDKYPLHSGASANSAAMIEAQLDAHRGEPFFSLARASVALFPTLNQDFLKLTGIDIQYEICGILQLAMNDEEATKLKKEIEIQKQMGLSIEWWNPDDIKAKYPELTISSVGGAFFAEDGQVNGARFLDASLQAAEKSGTTIRENVGDVDFLTKNGRLTGVRTETELFHADHLVVTAGAWTDTLLEPLNIRLGIEPIRGQLAVYETPPSLFPYPVYTTKDGYITPKRDGTTLAGTTVEKIGFDNSTTEAGREKIVNHAHSLAAGLQNFPIRKMTAGLRPRPAGDLPVIGPLPDFPNVIVAAGHYRNGVLLAPITAKIIAALVDDKPSPIDLNPFLPPA